jgi:hypothetical protein
VALVLIQLAAQERTLRQAVPLSPLLVEGAGGQATVLQTLTELGALVGEKGPEAQAALREMVVGHGGAGDDGEAEAPPLLLRKLLPRSLGPPGSAGHRMQERIEAAAPLPHAFRPLTDEDEGGLLLRLLRPALAELACVLRARPEAAMRRFAAVAARNLRTRQARRREQQQQLAWKMSVASVEARVLGDERAARVLAVGGRGGGGGGGGSREEL